MPRGAGHVPPSQLQLRLEETNMAHNAHSRDELRRQLTELLGAEAVETLMEALTRTPGTSWLRRLTSHSYGQTSSENSTDSGRKSERIASVSTSG